MNTSLLIKSLWLIPLLMTCMNLSFAGQLTTQDLLKLSIEELMEVKVVKETRQERQQIDTSSKTPILPSKSQINKEII